jgi:hypothetical protein
MFDSMAAFFREMLYSRHIKLINTPTTVYLAGNKGFKTTVRLPIKPFRLASFLTPDSLSSLDLSHFHLIPAKTFAC